MNCIRSAIFLSFRHGSSVRLSQRSNLHNFGNDTLLNFVACDESPVFQVEYLKHEEMSTQKKKKGKGKELQKREEERFNNRCIS